MKHAYLMLLVFILPLTSPAVTGYNGINLSIGAYHGSTTSHDRETNISRSNKSTNLTFGLGTTHSEGIYLGTIYDLNLKNDGNGNLQDYNLGVSLGFTDKGCYIVYHHFFKSEYQLDSTTKYHGVGMGFDMGYQASLGAGFSLGAQFSYKKLNFKDKIVNSEKIGADYSRENILPSLVFGFSF